MLPRHKYREGPVILNKHLGFVISQLQKQEMKELMIFLKKVREIYLPRWKENLSWPNFIMIIESLTVIKLVFSVEMF